MLKQVNNFYQLMMVFALIAAMYKLERQYYMRRETIPQNMTGAQKAALEIKKNPITKNRFIA